MSQIYVGPKPPRSYARLYISTVLLALYTAFVLLITMWPSPEQLEFDSIASRVLNVLHNFGVPERFGYSELEFTANILLFVPLGFLLGLALPRKAWWLALFLLPAFSGGIEFVQGVALDERVSTLQDVTANTLGGYIGLLLAMILRAMIHARDRTKIERELWERRAAAAAFQNKRAAQQAAAGAAVSSAANDPVTRVLDADFWNSNEAETLRIDFQ